MTGPVPSYRVRNRGSSHLSDRIVWTSNAVWRALTNRGGSFGEACDESAIATR